jgi:hypothetical protein
MPNSGDYEFTGIAGELTDLVTGFHSLTPRIPKLSCCCLSLAKLFRADNIAFQIPGDFHHGQVATKTGLLSVS